MKIGFLITGVGIFGSVREIVENGNVWTDMGHDVYIFNPEQESISWLPFKGTVLFEDKLKDIHLDILILTTTPNAKYYSLFENAKADFKVFCFMGWDPKFNVFETLPNLKDILSKYWITADSMWQINYMSKYTTKYINAQLGGVNTEMFRPLPKRNRAKLNIGWSGDHRSRKGGTELIKYFEKKGIPVLTYFNQGITQDKMAEWFTTIDIFIDNHYSGGWCNPVAEAMACKVPVICSDVLCNSGFAINNVTALKFDFNDMHAMQYQLGKMVNNRGIREQIAKDGYEYIKTFDYKIIAKNFLNALDSCKQREY